FLGEFLRTRTRKYLDRRIHNTVIWREDIDSNKKYYFEITLVYIMRKFSIKEWAETERPREKMLLLGTDHLSNTELLAILINTGTPQATAI
ncbi:UPF0758 domain-containing protein, partial [Acinetobacter baumannii]